MYKEIEGDLIVLAKRGLFDVIAHGCNCFCRMKRGIAPLMAIAFGCDKFFYEHKGYEGYINKLGTIDYEEGSWAKTDTFGNNRLVVVNAYTQYHWKGSMNLDYEALTLCMRKINHTFKGKDIGLPQIGAGLAGGDWNRIKSIIQTELKDCNVTIVIYNINN